MKTHERNDTPHDAPLAAESTEHLKTREGSEMVIGTNRRDTTDSRLHEAPATERFRRATSVRPVGIDVLPTP